MEQRARVATIPRSSAVFREDRGLGYDHGLN